MRTRKAVTTKTSRAKVPHSKGGCITCKTRHVKCDETKPTCMRCPATGWACDGYSSPKAAATKVAKERAVSRSLLPKPTKSPEGASKIQLRIFLSPQKRFSNEGEQVFFTNFRISTAAQLTGSFDAGLWHRVVMQACENDPPVFHAVVALGALSSILGKGHTAQYMQERREFAFQQYSKAIALHRKNVIEGGRTIRSNLITCVVFVNFEVMSGFVESATRLAYSGVKLMEDFFAGQDLEHVTSVSSPYPLQVEDELVQAFGRLELHAMGLSDIRSKEEHFRHSKSGQVSIDNMPQRFESLKESVIYVELVLRRSLHWAAAIYHEVITEKFQLSNVLMQKDSSFGDHTGFLEDKKAVVADFEKWRVSFEYLWLVAQSPEGEHLRFAASGIRLHYLSALLAVISMGATEDTYTGRYDPGLNEIIALCKYVLENTKNDGDVTWDVLIIIPLICVGYRFRNRKLRKEASDMLMSTSRREGVLESKVTGRMIEWLSELEEDGLGDDVEYVSEERIVKNTRITPDPEQKVTRITCEQPLAPTFKSMVKRKLVVRWEEEGVNM